MNFMCKMSGTEDKRFYGFCRFYGMSSGFAAYLDGWYSCIVSLPL